MKKIVKSIYNRQIKNNTKWCILRYPTEGLAQASNISMEEFEDFYFNVCTIDYGQMSKAMDNLVNLMNKTKELNEDKNKGSIKMQ